MKKKKIVSVLALLVVAVLLLTSCGAKFKITPEEFIEYAQTNDLISGEVTDEIKAGTDSETAKLLKSVHVMQNENVHIELWVWQDTDTAGRWFQSNKETLEYKASSNSGSDTTDSGNYTFKIDDVTYKLLFSGNSGIYAYGDKAELKDILKALKIDN